MTTFIKEMIANKLPAPSFLTQCEVLLQVVFLMFLQCAKQLNYSQMTSYTFNNHLIF